MGIRDRMVMFSFLAIVPFVMRKYVCLDNSNLAVIWSLMMSEKNVATEYQRAGYPFPERYMLHFVITDANKKRIIAGLKSENKEEILQAIFFMEVDVYKRQVLASLIRVVLLWIFAKWIPKEKFDKQSLAKLSLIHIS